MLLAIDMPWILEVARLAGAGDPAPDDFGVPMAAVARHQAALLDQDVYPGPVARAAALAHTLGRLRWLEKANMTVAVAVTVAYLHAAGRVVKPAQEDVTALVDELRDDACTAARVAALLRAWPT